MEKLNENGIKNLVKNLEQNLLPVGKIFINNGFIGNEFNNSNENYLTDIKHKFNIKVVFNKHVSTMWLDIEYTLKCINFKFPVEKRVYECIQANIYTAIKTNKQLLVSLNEQDIKNYQLIIQKENDIWHKNNVNCVIETLNNNK